MSLHVFIPLSQDRTAVAERADVELRTLFGYSGNEGVLQVFEGVEMRKLHVWLVGTCFLSQNYLSFHGRLFGLEKKSVRCVCMCMHVRVSRSLKRCRSAFLLVTFGSACWTVPAWMLCAGVR